MTLERWGNEEVQAADKLEEGHSDPEKGGDQPKPGHPLQIIEEGNSATLKENNVELADKQSESVLRSEDLEIGVTEDQQDLEESSENPSEEVEDLFFTIYVVENEICEIEEEIQKTTKGHQHSVKSGD